VWVSLDSSAAFVRRDQPLYQTRRFVERLDLTPRVMTVLRWKDFHWVPAFALHGTHYGERIVGVQVSAENLLRTAREFSLDLAAPSLARTFDPPPWLRRLTASEKLRHVIEPTAAYRNVSGVTNFNQVIRFDDLDLLSDTSELEVSIINRIYAKSGGNIRELLTWQVWQRRYFDPDFGGAIVPGRRNVFRTSTEMTAFAFLDRSRRYSPIVSALQIAPHPRVGVEWRTDYDPMRGRITNSTLTTDARFGRYFVGLGHNQVQSVPLLTPSSNQMLIRGGFGAESQRGWNAGFNGVYDFRLGLLQFGLTQVSYNTDCCGVSFQYRRFNFGTRNEHQFLASFVVANIGSFGTLKKQERLF
jgi:LPS-assembly protein